MEIDTVEVLQCHKWNITSMIDRITRKVALELYRGKSAKNFRQVINKSLFKFPIIHSITIDNGVENVQMGKLAKQWNFVRCNINVYASYEKGSIENMHRLIRRFLPKKNFIW